MGHVFSDHADSVVPLVDGAIVNIDASLGKIFTVTKGINGTLANPTNLRPGQEITVVITQDGTGSRTVAYGSLWKFPGGAPTATTAANSVDVIRGVYDGTRILAAMTKAYA
jgi:hypothetical protein